MAKRTIVVTIHECSGGGFAIGCRQSAWTGPTRLDLRLASIHPMKPFPPCPDGIPEGLWWAHHALAQRINDLDAEWWAKRDC